jgi:hypothetical protein
MTFILFIHKKKLYFKLQNIVQLVKNKVNFMESFIIIKSIRSYQVNLNHNLQINFDDG